MVKAAVRLGFLAFLVVAAGCHKRVTIESEPSGARVRVNGVNRGVTPVTLDLEYNIFITHNVELEKEGYRRAYAPIPSEGNVGLAICGYIICPPLIIWARAPVSEAIFVLTAMGESPDGSMMSPPPPPPPPLPPAVAPDAVSSASAAWTPAPAPTPLPRPAEKGPLFIKTKRGGLQEVAAGRKVDVALTNGEKISGKIGAVAEHGIVVVTSDGERVLAADEIDQIHRAK